MTSCQHCGRTIIRDGGLWVDPEATGDDEVWRETCDSHDTFVAEHEPEVATDEASLFALWEVDLADHAGIKDAQAQADAVGWILDHPDFGAPR